MDKVVMANKEIYFFFFLQYISFLNNVCAVDSKDRLREINKLNELLYPNSAKDFHG